MVNIRKVNCPVLKTAVKCPYKMTPTRIVIHNTANDATANNEIAYMHRNNYQTSFHYAVDDKEIVQGIELNRNAWHASDGRNGIGNRQGIAIEICYSKSGGIRFEQAQKNAAELTASLLNDYGWGIEKVTKHEDYTNKHCPHRTLDDYGWDNFLNLIKWYMSSNKTKTDASPIQKENKVLEWQRAALADGFSFPKYGADGRWGDECISVAKKAICKKRTTYKYRNLTKIVQRAVGATPDGLFGTNTKNAVIAYQKRNGLEQDGCVGPDTWRKILEV